MLAKITPAPTQVHPSMISLKSSQPSPAVNGSLRKSNGITALASAAAKARAWQKWAVQPEIPITRSTGKSSQPGVTQTKSDGIRVSGSIIRFM